MQLIFAVYLDLIIAVYLDVIFAVYFDMKFYVLKIMTNVGSFIMNWNMQTLLRKDWSTFERVRLG